MLLFERSLDVSYCRSTLMNQQSFKEIKMDLLLPIVSVKQPGLAQVAALRSRLIEKTLVCKGHFCEKFHQTYSSKISDGIAIRLPKKPKVALHAR